MDVFIHTLSASPISDFLKQAIKSLLHTILIRRPCTFLSPTVAARQWKEHLNITLNDICINIQPSSINIDHVSVFIYVWNTSLASMHIKSEMAVKLIRWLAMFFSCTCMLADIVERISEWCVHFVKKAWNFGHRGFEGCWIQKLREPRWQMNGSRSKWRIQDGRLENRKFLFLRY